jgi:hypothetical protein
MTNRLANTALAITLGTLVLAAPANARNHINARQASQQHRIDRGVANGSLNARETNRLDAREAHIANYEARSRADGGGLDGRERLRIRAMQNRTSRAIYRQKHDAQGQ